MRIITEASHYKELISKKMAAKARTGAFPLGFILALELQVN